MRANSAMLLIPALLVPVASGQTVSRMFHFEHTDGAQNINQIATSIRTTADIKEAQTDPAQKTLSLSGTVDQLALAAWLFNELDQPLIPAPNNRDEASRQFVMEGGGDNTVRIFRLPETETIQHFQEAATAIRTVADIRRVFTYNAPRALIVRGTGDQIALAAWLIDEIAQPSGQEYRLPLDSDRFGEVVVRVFHVAHAQDIGSFREIATAVRRIANIRRVFTYDPSRAVIVRSDAGAVAVAAWLLSQLDLPAPGPSAAAAHSSASYEYDDAVHNPDNMIRIFYLPQISTVQGFQQMASSIRATTHIQRVFTYNQPRAIALRGTINQLTQAELIIEPSK